MRFLAICFCAMAALPVAAGAQQSLHSASGPTIQAAAVGFRTASPKVDASTARAVQVRRPHAGQDVALMAVGLGAMIAGGIVGGDAGTIFIIGGAAVALFGLYHYLQ